MALEVWLRSGMTGGRRGGLCRHESGAQVLPIELIPIVGAGAGCQVLVTTVAAESLGRGAKHRAT